MNDDDICTCEIPFTGQCPACQEWRATISGWYNNSHKVNDERTKMLDQIIEAMLAAGVSREEIAGVIADWYEE
jgi:hypothetical protein